MRWSAECAEVAAVLFGPEIAHRLGYKHVILECDVVNVISTIKKEVVGFSPLFLFYEDIKRLKSYFESFDCAHIRRTCNTIAHWIARWDINVGDERVWTSCFPGYVTTLANLDFC